MRTSEWVTCLYVGYLSLAAWRRVLPSAKRWQLAGLALLIILAILAMAGVASSPALEIARDWLPAVYLIVGYWLSGSLYVGPQRRAEERLARFDRWLFSPGGFAALERRIPRPLLEYLELSYLACYVLVPAGFAVLYAAGLRAAADRFWTTVLLSEFACYGMLPWIQTRPPRALEPAGDPASPPLTFRRVNLLVLRTGSIQVNTFPSGHAAGALATALVVGRMLPVAGALFAIVALSIATAAVVGRYHYAADVLIGLLIALAADGLVAAGAIPVN